ncbi:MAG: hypothetical protein ACRBBN_06365 [Methyloligellaceae bacterium]
MADNFLWGITMLNGLLKRPVKAVFALMIIFTALTVLSSCSKDVSGDSIGSGSNSESDRSVN